MCSGKLSPWWTLPAANKKRIFRFEKGDFHIFGGEDEAVRCKDLK